MLYSVVAAAFSFHCMAVKKKKDFSLPVLNVDSMHLQINVKMKFCVEFSEKLKK